MPSRTEDKIYETFVKVAGGQAESTHSAIDASARIAQPGTSKSGEIQTAKPVTWRSTGSGSSSAATTSSSTGAAQSVASSVLQNVFSMSPLTGGVAGASSSGGGGGIGGTIESIASTVLKSGLGMAPLIGGLLGLFGGDDAPSAPVLTKYAMPESIAFEGANLGSSYGGVDSDQMGMPRVNASNIGAVRPSSSNSSVATAGPTARATDGGMSPGSGGGSNATTPAPQITVNVQAMDARSFLDRSGDIAAAVREAMLNMSSINDVVNEL